MELYLIIDFDMGLYFIRTKLKDLFLCWSINELYFSIYL